MFKKIRNLYYKYRKVELKDKSFVRKIDKNHSWLFSASLFFVLILLSVLIYLIK